MTYNHHTIVVVGIRLKAAHNKAKKLFNELVSDIIYGMNGIESFFIGPDGSGEGWVESDNFDNLREKFIEYLANKEIKHIHVSISDQWKVEVL